MAQEMLMMFLRPVLYSSSYSAISVACTFHSSIPIVPVHCCHCRFGHVVSLSVPVPIPIIVLWLLSSLWSCGFLCHWCLSPCPHHQCCPVGLFLSLWLSFFFVVALSHLCHACCSFPPHRYKLLCWQLGTTQADSSGGWPRDHRV
jgi:hypothetical protein